MIIGSIKCYSAASLTSDEVLTTATCDDYNLPFEYYEIIKQEIEESIFNDKTYDTNISQLKFLNKLSDRMIKFKCNSYNNRFIPKIRGRFNRPQRGKRSISSQYPYIGSKSA